MKYEEPSLDVLYFTQKDIISTSGNTDDEWKDENTDDNGWLLG